MADQPPSGDLVAIPGRDDKPVPPDSAEAMRRRAMASARVESMDRLASLAAHLLDAPAAQISIIADQHIAAGHHGFELSARESPVEESLCAVTVRTGEILMISDTHQDGRVSFLSPVASGSVGAYLSVPLNVNNQPVGSLDVFDSVPHEWTERDSRLLAALADSVNAELEAAGVADELVNSLMRLDLGFTAAEIGSFDWNIQTGELAWDTRLQAMFGYTPETFTPHISSFWAPMFEADRPRVEKVLAQAMERGNEYATEFRIHRGDEACWITGRGRVLFDDQEAPTRVIGAAFESSHVHSTSVQISRLLDTMDDVFYAVDRDWNITYFNAAAEERLNRGRSELIGKNLWDAFPHLRGTGFEDHFRAAMSTQEPHIFQDYSTLLDGFFEVRAFPNPDGMSISLIDVTNERTVEAQRAEAIDARELAAAEANAANARLDLLTQIAQVLMDSFDVDGTIKRVMDLMVPKIAAYAAVHLLESDRLRLVCVKGIHEQAEIDLREVNRPGNQDDSSFTGALYVATSGKGQFFDRFSTDSAGLTEVQEAAWTRLEPSSGVVLPLSARGRTLGALTLMRTNDERMTSDDIRLFEVVAARLGLAIDNAQLFEYQKSISETLQRSLLTPPPEPDHLQLEVRYVPAIATAQVGGDWYDAFLRQDGSTMLVVGDVMGHDVTAAAAMGQLRTLVRSTAYDRDEETPAEVLQRVDAMMKGLGVTTLATAILASVTQSEDEKERGERRVQWSSAGHPPPILIHNDCSWEVLRNGDMILGFDHTIERTTHSTVLPPYSTLLLYTDGLVERRDEATEDNIDALAEYAASHANEPLQALLDRVLERYGEGDAEDDIAIVALRTFPEDRPRPASAGRIDVPDELPPTR